MSNEFFYLLWAAITIGTVHTLIGVDHYVPFIALSKSNNWSIRKTILIVIICGIGHVLSSVILGFIGVALEVGISSLVNIESIRGEIATWFLIVFGIIYTLWSIRNIYKNKPHKHIGADGKEFVHNNSHYHNQSQHENAQNSKVIWGLFILFVLGPCEPLIPILMYPAAMQNTSALIIITAVFAICTISVMMLATFVGIKGLNLLKIKNIEKFADPLAGASITVCGILILTMGI